jgi:hypothetical protein
MPGLFADRVKESATTTGTGDFTLAGAATQFEAFSTNFAVGDPFYYVIVGQGGTEWEVGLGQLSGSTTLVRTTVLQSSNADALVNFSSGTKDVFVAMPAYWANQVLTQGQIVALASGMAMP